MAHSEITAEGASAACSDDGELVTVTMNMRSWQALARFASNYIVREEEDCRRIMRRDPDRDSKGFWREREKTWAVDHREIQKLRSIVLDAVSASKKPV